MMNRTDIDIQPDELSARLAGGDVILLLDVRNGWEHELAKLESSVLIPMQMLAARIAEIPRDRDVVVYCHHGMRSRMAAQFLQQEGIRAVSLHGGIDLWSRTVDPGVPRY